MFTILHIDNPIFKTLQGSVLLRDTSFLKYLEYPNRFIFQEYYHALTFVDRQLLFPVNVFIFKKLHNQLSLPGGKRYILHNVSAYRDKKCDRFTPNIHEEKHVFKLTSNNVTAKL